jgi:hypothetical protein
MINSKYCLGGLTSKCDWRLKKQKHNVVKTRTQLVNLLTISTGLPAK